MKVVGQMKVGCVKEIKPYEYRVGLTPENVKEYLSAGHQVYIQQGAGEGSSFSDLEYQHTGAVILSSAKEVWDQCEMIVKVKEPLAEEYPLMRPGQILYTYLHLAANQELTDTLMKNKVNAVAYETIKNHQGKLPLLQPMSEVAGRLSVQAGARCLEKPMGGIGLLLGGVPGVKKARVVVVGGGTVGTQACMTALGMGADVVIFDNSIDRLSYIDQLFHQQVQTLYSTDSALENELAQADLVIGAVLIPGAATPKLIKKSYLKKMKKGSVIVDVAVDQGGCCETTRPTYHDNPVYLVDGVVHYCVANMPAAVSQTSTIALTNATLRYGLEMASQGLETAAKKDPFFKYGINCYGGYLTCREVAEGFSIPYTDIDTLIK